MPRDRIAFVVIYHAAWFIVSRRHQYDKSNSLPFYVLITKLFLTPFIAYLLFIVINEDNLPLMFNNIWIIFRDDIPPSWRLCYLAYWITQYITTTSHEVQASQIIGNSIVCSNVLFRLASKKIPKLHITGPLWGESIGDWWIPLIPFYDYLCYCR